MSSSTEPAARRQAVEAGFKPAKPPIAVNWPADLDERDLHAWFVFNGLLPIIEQRLASGEWPQLRRRTLTAHPAFGERRLVPTTEAQAAWRAAAP